MIADAEDIYFTATGQQDGNPLVFRSITSVPKGVNKREFPSLIVVSWRYKLTEKGMPDAEVNEAQIELEDILTPLDANHTSRQMLVVTGNGRKVWYWYVRDVARWKAQAECLLGQYGYPIRITDADDHDWSFYENFKAGVEGLQIDQGR
jgi:hypothetical protein